MKRLTYYSPLAAFVLAIACNPVDSTAPRTHAPTRGVNDDAACQGQITYNPDCAGSSETGAAVADGWGQINAVITIEGVTQPPNVPCPVAWYGVLASGTIGSPFSPPVPFVVTGTFRLDPNSPSPRYIFPTGWWDVADGSGRQVSIGSADVTCTLEYNPNTNTAKIRVQLGPRFYNVFVRVPNSSGGSTSGGGSPGGAACEMEFITIQTNDGSGWKDWWSGWAQVCT